MYRARLPSKPDVDLCYSLLSLPRPTQAKPTEQKLIVFLNNLLLPAESWNTSIALFSHHRDTLSPEIRDEIFPYNSQTWPQTIPILTYDRFGQGATTDHDPKDSRPGVEQGYGHDYADVVSDLHELIYSLIPKLFPLTNQSVEPQPIHLLLVGASIGAPIARLYAQTYPHTVAGMILLDSNIANADYSSFWPDPHAEDFDPTDVIADDCSLEQFIEQTQKLRSLFDLNVKNPENLDRRNSALLLPHSDLPILLGPSLESADERTKVMVVGHDPVTFADQSFERTGTPRSFVRRWIQTAWDRYNDGLLRIGDSSPFGDRVRIAPGCGHFIQKDDAQFVADVVRDMLDVLGW